MTPDNQLAFADTMMKTMRQFFERDGHLDPVAFVIATRDYDTRARLREPEVITLPFHFKDPEDKKEAAELVRDVAQRTAALGVLCGFECWLLRGEDEEELQRAVARGLQDHPDRFEVIYVRLELASGEFVWTAEIDRDSDGRPSLRPFRLDDGEIGVGQFSRFLPPVRQCRFDA